MIVSSLLNFYSRYASKKQDFKSKPKKKKEKEDKAKKQQQPKLKNDQDKENIPKSNTTATVKMPIKNSTSTSLMNVLKMLLFVKFIRYRISTLHTLKIQHLV